MKSNNWRFFLCSLVAGCVSLSATPSQAAVIINEIHYDNISTDMDEFVEIVTTEGEAAADITVSLYNGSDDELYGSNDTFNLASDFVDHGTLGDGNQYYSLTLPTDGLQNGAPDGIAVDLGGVVQEFLSYEGVVGPAGDGPAAGLTSTDIGISQGSDTPLGSSLQRYAFGTLWVETEGSNTLGEVNDVIPEPSAVLLALLGLCVSGAAGIRSRLG